MLTEVAECCSPCVHNALMWRVWLVVDIGYGHRYTALPRLNPLDDPALFLLVGQMFLLNYLLEAGLVTSTVGLVGWPAIIVQGY